MADMRKSKFSEEQIIGFLKQAEAGMAVTDICRKGGCSDATFYKWRAKFGGMEASDARRLRELEAENNKLKHLLAEAHLDMHALKSVLGVKR
jgi:putative transposase